jgi:hypothetical protein
MDKFAFTSAAALLVVLASSPAFAAKTSIKCGDGKVVTISVTGGNCTSGTYGSCTTSGEKDFTSGGCIGGEAKCGASGGSGSCTIAKTIGTSKPKLQRAPNAGVKAQ